jgi:hypothetical protein
MARVLVCSSLPRTAESSYPRLLLLLYCLQLVRCWYAHVLPIVQLVLLLQDCMPGGAHCCCQGCCWCWGSTLLWAVPYQGCWTAAGGSRMCVCFLNLAPAAVGASAGADAALAALEQHSPRG